MNADREPDLPDRRARDRRDTRMMLIVTLATAVVIAMVLWLAGAFRPSTG